VWSVHINRIHCTDSSTCEIFSVFYLSTISGSAFCPMHLERMYESTASTLFYPREMLSMFTLSLSRAAKSLTDFAFSPFSLVGGYADSWKRLTKC